MKSSEDTSTLIKNFGYSSMVNSNQVANTLRSQLSNRKPKLRPSATKLKPETKERYSEIKNMSLGNLVSINRESEGTLDPLEQYGKIQDSSQKGDHSNLLNRINSSKLNFASMKLDHSSGRAVAIKDQLQTGSGRGRNDRHEDSDKQEEALEFPVVQQRPASQMNFAFR